MNLKTVNRISSENKGIGIEIVLQDGNSFSLSNEKLRKNCPCASCLEKRGDTTHQSPLKPTGGKTLLKVISATSEEELNLEKIWVLGNYALGMKWGDGHDSGIYTFDFLAQLSK